MSRLPITVIVLTKNEEPVIRRTVRAARLFAQVLVVDSNSTDNTREIAREEGAEVVEFSWNGLYPKKKQWSLELPQVAHDWVLFVDADEAPTNDLVSEISDRLAELQRQVNAAYSIRLDYYFLGRKLRYGHRVSKIALVDRRRCAFPEVDDLGVQNMWEVEGHYQPTVHGSVGRFRATMSHYDIDPLYDYFARHNRYSDWEAHIAESKNGVSAVVETRSATGRLFHRVPFKPIAFFVYAFVVRRGFLDGSSGFHHAVAQAFYYWQIAVKRRELSNAGFGKTQ